MLPDKVLIETGDVVQVDRWGNGLILGVSLNPETLTYDFWMLFENGELGYIHRSKITRIFQAHESAPVEMI